MKLFKVSRLGFNTVIGQEFADDLSIDLHVVKGVHPYFTEWVHILCESFQEKLQKAVEYHHHKRRNHWKIIHNQSDYGAQYFSFEFLQKRGSYWKQNRKPILNISQKGKVGYIRAFLPDLIALFEYMNVIKISEDGAVTANIPLTRTAEKHYDEDLGWFESYRPCQVPILGVIYAEDEAETEAYELEIQEVEPLPFNEQGLAKMGYHIVRPQRDFCFEVHYYDEEGLEMKKDKFVYEGRSYGEAEVSLKEDFEKKGWDICYIIQC